MSAGASAAAAASDSPTTGCSRLRRTAWARMRRAGQRRAHPGPLDRQARLGQAPPDDGQQPRRLRHPRDAAQERHAHHGVGHVRLLAGRKPDLAVLGSHGRGPVGEAVDEDAVAKRHPAQPDGRRAHPASPIVRATCRKQRTASSRSSIAARSSAEWTSTPARSGSIRIGHEAVGDRAERLAHVVAVGEPGVDHRRERRPGLDLRRELLERAIERRAHGRERAADVLDELELEVDPGQGGSHGPLDLGVRHLRKDPAVAHKPRAAGDDVDRRRGLADGRRDRGAQHRLDRGGQERVLAAAAADELGRVCAVLADQRRGSRPARPARRWGAACAGSGR